MESLFWSFESSRCWSERFWFYESIHARFWERQIEQSILDAKKLNFERTFSVFRILSATPKCPTQAFVGSNRKTIVKPYLNSSQTKINTTTSMAYLLVERTASDSLISKRGSFRLLQLSYWRNEVGLYRELKYLPRSEMHILSEFREEQNADRFWFFETDVAPAVRPFTVVQYRDVTDDCSGRRARSLKDRVVFGEWPDEKWLFFFHETREHRASRSYYAHTSLFVDELFDPQWHSFGKTPGFWRSSTLFIFRIHTLLKPDRNHG